jgi:HEAT repeat protein
MGKVHMAVDAQPVSALLNDSDAVVRKRAAELLDHGRVKVSAQSLLKLAQNDADSEVRLAACHALGSLGDGTVRSALEDIAQKDANSLVRDQARIAARRL